jgi:hypothetical protein
MPADADHYEVYYADKLWATLPAIYRALDSNSFTTNGPLREMVNRIGAQAAIVRRSIDRLWEDQSIESCDDWVIAYIGDLLATNLVASLDARGQRLDVAKTIYYRRRKGTVAILEEIAHDITGWDARVVEFFRRLGRTRHNFDPPIVAAGDTQADDLTLQLAEGLTGLWTNTKIGGWADLRNAYGASQAQSPFSIAPTPRPASAFDEYFHTADFRAGRGRSGWYNIPNLGVFVWRLISFGVDQTTPVQHGNCYTFDPTGRQAPLFAVSSRPLGDTWVSPQEWQLPTPISTPLLRACLAAPQSQPLYALIAPDGVTLEPNSLGVFVNTGTFYELIDVSQVSAFPQAAGASHQIVVFPENGRFEMLPPPSRPITVTYHYGFSSPIGAGPYDRRVIGGTPTPTPAPQTDVKGGGYALGSAGAIPPIGTVTIDDSLTYYNAADVPAVQQLTLMAANRARPLIRFQPLPPSTWRQWIINGLPGSTLVLEGLWVSGADIVLTGSFDSIAITCCTFDPGTAQTPAVGTQLFAQSLDGRPLAPCRIWIEAEVTQMTIDRSITGPIRTRANGEVETLTVTNSIIQSIPTAGSGLITTGDLKDPVRLATRLRDGLDALSLFLYNQLSPATRTLLHAQPISNPPSAPLVTALLTDLNHLIGAKTTIYLPSAYGVIPTPAVTQLMAEHPAGPALVRLNRMLLDLAYPIELADLALGFVNGVTSLSRCTVLGPFYAHKLEASECILDDLATVENTQDGCVRFSAWAAGSALPRKYESAQIAPSAPLFQSQFFGQPGYAQLLESVDNAIQAASQGVTISAGAADGSEMGAFASQKNPIKERSLLLKYQEYMPLGLNPIIIHVT